MPLYSPFETTLDQLQPVDLTALHKTREGWYVEYKSEAPTASSLAKSVSAFANTSGGWLFLGVKEESKENAVAGSFPGIDVSQLDALSQRLRHAAAEHLNPPPFFEHEILRGPCDSIGLEANRAVVAIQIPQSLTTPHVHRDGRIYRRVADGSEPKHETDRFMLDQLWRRDRPIRKKVRRWIKQDPAFSNEERVRPYIRLLLCVDPWHQKPTKLAAPLDEIRNVLTGQDAAIASTPLDSVYTMPGGFVARQLRGNQPANLTLTWTMSRQLRGDVVFPLPVFHAYELEDLESWLRGYAHSEDFISILRNQGHTEVKVLDLNLLMNVLIGTVSKYRRLLAMAGLETHYFVKARVLHAGRMFPFIDVRSLLAEFSRFGIPMLMKNTLSIPTGYEPDSFVHVFEPDISGSENREQAAGGVQAALVFSLLAHAFGIRHLADQAPKEQKEDLYTELTDAGQRALAVQSQRNEQNALDHGS